MERGVVEDWCKKMAVICMPIAGIFLYLVFIFFARFPVPGSRSLFPISLVSAIILNFN
jgi:hypothetical protein